MAWNNNCVTSRDQTLKGKIGCHNTHRVDGYSYMYLDEVDPGEENSTGDKCTTDPPVLGVGSGAG